MKKKTIALLLACMMVLGVALGGTLAWLTDSTESVVNTFTVGNIDIELAETTTEYKMIPGYTIAKDPKVTVDADSEDCYVFVKLEKSENYDAFLVSAVPADAEDGKPYTLADGWTALEGVEGVFYRVVKTTDETKEFYVLKDNQLAVKTTVTKDMMDGLTDTTLPTLTFTAYACQYMKNNTENFTPAEAWTNVNA